MPADAALLNVGGEVSISGMLSQTGARVPKATWGLLRYELMLSDGRFMREKTAAKLIRKEPLAAFSWSQAALQPR